MSDVAIRKVVDGLPVTPLEVGIEKTMSRFANLREEGRLDVMDLES